MLIKTSFRCTPAERKELEQYSKKNQKTLSEYIRLRLLEPETVQGKLALHAALSQTTEHLAAVSQHLAENQKILTAVLNTLFQFMASDIGQDKAREIFDSVINRMEAD